MDKQINKIPLVRFPEFKDGWKVKRLGDYIYEIKDYPIVQLPLFSLTIEKGIIQKSKRYERSFLVNDTKKAYKTMKYNDFAFNPMKVLCFCFSKCCECSTMKFATHCAMTVSHSRF